MHRLARLTRGWEVIFAIHYITSLICVCQYYFGVLFNPLRLGIGPWSSMRQSLLLFMIIIHSPLPTSELRPLFFCANPVRIPASLIQVLPAIATMLSAHLAAGRPTILLLVLGRHSITVYSTYHQRALPGVLPSSILDPLFDFRYRKFAYVFGS